MGLPERKHPRMKHYDYHQCGCYHITICTKYHRAILSKVIPATNPAERASIHLNRSGHIAAHYIQNIPKVYHGVFLEKYVIMPNHVHLLISLDSGSTVSISTIVRSLKRMINRDLGESIWQDSFYDVIVRNDAMFQCEWMYIDNNPDKWAEDELFTEKY